jgi:hypothetical protein
MVLRLKAHTTTTIGATANHQNYCAPIFAWANVTFKQATVLKGVVASGTFLSSLFRERVRVPSKENASKPRDPSSHLRSPHGIVDPVCAHHLTFKFNDLAA